ncbi:aggregation-promoting factor C-terminal-like domain-containing protein [Salinactinospora qingdaonensis]|uniref:Transglycosylase SLT domain-containing protein n=1 Tax=Salinactinospora qingdaonensis TaxID=702744 RepID=A0ABP7FN87_9ACTN
MLRNAFPLRSRRGRDRATSPGKRRAKGQFSLRSALSLASRRGKKRVASAKRGSGGRFLPRTRGTLWAVTAAASVMVVAGAVLAAIVLMGDMDTTPGSEQAAADMRALPTVSESAASESPFFPKTQETAEENLAARLDEARKKRQEAVDSARSGAAADVAAEQEEEEEEPEEDTGSDDTDGPEYSGDPKSIAQAMLADYGWSADQFNCLEPLWEKESNWDHTARNPSSGAYGIPQALPGSKMATAGADWQTNPATQIEWGLGYISERYGTPCGAWEKSQTDGWY